MRQFVLATLVGVSLAAEAEVLSAVMQNAPFSRAPGQQQNGSNFDRRLPTFASEQNRGTERQAAVINIRSGDELIPIKERNAKKAERDPVLAQKPKGKPLYKGSKDFEPIDPSGRKFRNPVFLVDPKFKDKDLTPEEDSAFMDSDLGNDDVVSPTKWPFIQKEIQEFFNVGPDCQNMGNQKIGYKEPQQWKRLPVSDYYEAAWEPIEEKTVARHNQESCYLGDDFGGHNYPFPHPRPPTPDKYYVDGFIDITAYYHNGIRIEP